MRLRAGSLIHINLQGKTMMGADDGDLIHNLAEKIKQFLLTLGNFFSFPIAWFNKVFPPETRKDQIQHWIHVGAPYVVVALTLLLLFWCCGGCLSSCFIAVFRIVTTPFVWLWNILTYCIRIVFQVVKAPFIWLWNILTYCFQLVKAPFMCCMRGLKMMKAPGRRGHLMPRSVFEANPRGYFRDLRAGNKINY